MSKKRLKSCKHLVNDTDIFVWKKLNLKVSQADKYRIWGKRFGTTYHIVNTIKRYTGE